MAVSERSVVFSIGAVPTPMHLASRKHWIEQGFESMGIDVHNLWEHPKGETMHYYHSHERQFRIGGTFSNMWAHANGADTRVVSMLWVPCRTDMLVKAGSHLESPAQLRGCRLSLPVRSYLPVDYPRASAYYAYANILMKNGIGLDEVRFVTVPVKRRQHAQQEGLPSFMPHNTQRPAAPQQEEVELLAAGGADVMLSQLGRGLLHLQSGNLRSIFTSIPPAGDHRDYYSANAYPVLTVVNRDFAAQRPDLVKLWLRLEFMTAAWARDNPEDNAAALAGMTDIPVSLLPEAYSSDYLNCLLPEMDEDGRHTLVKIKEFSLAHGLLPRDFSIDEWLAPEFLAEVRQDLSM